MYQLGMVGDSNSERKVLSQYYVDMSYVYPQGTTENKRPPYSAYGSDNLPEAEIQAANGGTLAKQLRTNEDEMSFRDLAPFVHHGGI